MKKKIIAIIPARKNSTRLKNKNFKKFNGRPLIQWTVETAIKSKYIDKVLVSSDSIKILNLCSKYKDIILSKRKKKLSLKNSKIEDVITEEIKNNSLLNFDYFILLQPTSPLRTVKTIDASIKLILKKNKATCVSFYKVKENYLNIYKIEKTRLKKIKPKKKSSLKGNYFIPSGDVYISNVKKFLKDKKFIKSTTIPYIIEHKYSDIDYKEEFEIAEKTHKV